MARKRKSTASKQESQSEKQTLLGLEARWRGDSRLISILAFGIFVLVFAPLTITSLLQKSPTVDEPVHLLAGYSYLKWADFRVNPEHPPLAKALAALPLLAFDFKDPRLARPYWDRIPTEGPWALHTVNVAGRMLFVDNDAETLFFYAKLMMIALGILLGLFVYRWSKELFGVDAAIVSLLVYGLDPNILAHSQLVHTDLPFTTFFFIGTYYFWRGLSQLSWRNLALTSLFFGLAAITKYAYLAIFLVWGVLGLLKILSSEPQQCTLGIPRAVSSRWGKVSLLTGVLICALITGYLFIWAAYGFRFDAIPGGEQHLPMVQEMPENPLLQALATFIIQHRLFPEAWIYGQLHVFKHLSRDAYLLGQILIGDGFWLYFPVAFAVKTPLPTLLLLAATIGIWIFKRRNQMAGLFLLIPVVVYFSLGVWSKMNIGLRHILPIYPFLFVLIGGTAAELWRDRTWIKKGSLILLGVWYLWSSLSIYPHYLAFFNELVGGPKNGAKVLLDSNLDWGQDLKGLKRWMDGNEVKKIQFLYFGFFNIAAPEYYKINARYLPGSWIGHSPPIEEDSTIPNFVAISANHLFGPLLLREGEKDFVKPFRSIEPITTIGHSIFIFRIDQAMESFRRAVQTNPDSAEAHYYLANLLDNQGIGDEAIEHYRQAVQLNPRLVEAHNKLGISLARRGDFKNAIQHLRKVLELGLSGSRKKGESLTHYYLGTLLAQQGHLIEAIKHFDKALDIKPDFAEAYHNLGRVLAAQGRMDQAIEHFREALRIQPEFAEAHESLGRALDQQGKRDEAARHYQ